MYLSFPLSTGCGSHLTSTNSKQVMFELHGTADPNIDLRLEFLLFQAKTGTLSSVLDSSHTGATSAVIQHMKA